MNPGTDQILVPQLSILKNTVQKVSALLAEKQGPSQVADFEQAREIWRSIEAEVKRIGVQMVQWEKRVEQEKKTRRKELSNPSSPESLAANLRWSIEKGSKEALDLILQLQRKKNPRYYNPTVKHLIDMAIQKLSGQGAEEDDSPLIARRESEKAYRAHKQEWEQKYAGQYIAVYRGAVIDSDTDETELALKIIEKQRQEKRPFRACILRMKPRAQKTQRCKENASSSVPSVLS